MFRCTARWAARGGIVRYSCLLALPFASALAQPTSGGALTTFGLPGQVVTPAAGALPLGWLSLGVNTAPDIDTYWQNRDALAGGQQLNMFASFGLFSRVAVSVRMSDRRSIEPDPIDTIIGVTGPVVFPIRSIDLSANILVLLAHERGPWPALAIGALDVVGTKTFASRFVVATKSLGPSTRLSVGVGDGASVLHGLFGGVDAAPLPWLGARAEWNGKRTGVGFWIQPSLPFDIDRVVRVPRLESYWVDGGGWRWGASLAVPWDGAFVEPGTESKAHHPRPAAERPHWSTAEELTSLLAEAGLEDVRAVIAGDSVLVAYEDRVHLRSRADGLALVLEIVAENATHTFHHAEIFVLASGRPVLRASITADANGRDDGPSGLHKGSARYAYVDHLPATLVAARPPAMRKTPIGADLVIEPVFDTHLAWERGPFDARVGVIPTLELPLARGLHASIGFYLPLAQTPGMEVTEGPLPRPGWARTLLSYVWNDALSPMSAVASHVSLGHFGGGRAGVRDETALMLAGGLLRFDADVAVTRDVANAGALPYGTRPVPRAEFMGVLGARLLLPESGVRIGVTAGRYLWGDDGATVELSRFFGDTQLSFGIRQTGNGRLGTFTLSLPLVPHTSQPPRSWRLRGPSEWSYGQGITLERVGTVSFIIGERLPGDLEVWDRFLDRDRLHPAAMGAATTSPDASPRP